MTDGPILIKRYPNRRYYARNTSKYVSLTEIEEMVKAGETVEIRDSQTGDDMTQSVLTQIIMERYPEKMSLFPTDMLHFILRSNDAMSGFLGDYFRHSLAYVDYLQRHNPAASAMARPLNWMKAWLDSVSPARPSEPKEGATPEPESDPLGERVKELEDRIRQLESKGS